MHRDDNCDFCQRAKLLEPCPLCGQPKSALIKRCWTCDRRKDALTNLISESERLGLYRQP
jgi:hypothetical protein